MMKTTKLVLPACILMVLLGCKKDLELDPNGYAGVQELLCSRNLNVGCGETAEFEGLTLGIRGLAPEEYREPNQYRFFLYDTADEDYRIEVQVDSLVNSDVFAFLSTHTNKTILLRGILEGYDKPQNLKCRRGYLLKIVSAGDISAE